MQRDFVCIIPRAWHVLLNNLVLYIAEDECLFYICVALCLFLVFVTQNNNKVVKKGRYLFVFCCVICYSISKLSKHKRQLRRKLSGEVRYG